VYVALSASPRERVVGAITTEIDVTELREMSVLSTCAVSLDDVQARTRMCVWVDSVHVKDTSDPALALAVQAVAAPEPAAVTVAAEPAAPHDGELETAVVPER